MGRGEGAAVGYFIGVRWGLEIQIKNRVPCLECQLGKGKCGSHDSNLASSRQIHNNSIAGPFSQFHAKEVSPIWESHPSFEVDLFPLLQGFPSMKC